MKNLSTLFGALLLLFVTACGASPFGKVTAEQANDMVANQNAIIIDVRENDEWNSQHIPGAIHIPLGQVQSRLAELEQYQGKPIIMQCRSGIRSARASGILTDAGFTDVYNLTGGIIAWSKSGLKTQ